ncbi:MAG TPA: minichromosome maintenance protein MCM [Thermoplasmata archaeon]|jgi:replicative DNA helicase Mcm|nr:minichromosome maintenance protein MCM [Thermoplasmata archaeon]
MVAVKRTLPAPPELQSRWASVLEEAGLRPRVLELHDRFPEERSLEVPFATIDSTDTPLADLLLERPEVVIDAGVRALKDLLPVASPEADQLRLRVIGLPSTARRAVRAIRESDLNRLLALDGIVRRVTEVRPQIRDAVFECVACRTKFHEEQDETSLIFREPLECPEAQGGCGKTQGRTRFRLIAEESTYVDAQRIEIQEHPETLRHGAHPQGLSVLLTEDLTGKVLPGNRIVLNGVLKSFQRASASRGGVVRNTTFDLMMVGNSFESTTQEYEEIELTPDDIRLIEQFRGDPTVVDKIVLSLAPTIKGMEEEKEAIALQLFGGVEKRHADNIRVRGDIHCLLVGDPGTAKSQLLRYISEVAPRGIYTSGKGATAAGLTAAAVKDDFAGGRWVLEAGMLVLADGGMAIVDELDKMSPEDRSAMHETLESGTVSIAKAGITSTLNARCPVLAAANPKWGRFTNDRTIAEQIDLPPTLLSRFDVIYSIRDVPDQEHDRLLASKILASHRDVEHPGPEGEFGGPGGAPFPPLLLKKYIAYARRNVRPSLAQAALDAIENYYVRVRHQGEEPNAPVPITARQLEALVRMSEAAARARLSPTVELEDAERAIHVMQSFLRRVSMTEEGKIDIDLVQTGVSHSQRERMDIALRLMRELQEQANGTFTLEQYHEAAEKAHITRTQADSILQTMRNQGEIIEPRPNQLQLVRF